MSRNYLVSCDVPFEYTDQSIVVATLACIGNLTCIPNADMLNEQLVPRGRQQQSDTGTIMDSLLRIAMTGPTAARIEALCVLCKAVKHYEPLVRYAMSQMGSVLCM